MQAALLYSRCCLFEDPGNFEHAVQDVAWALVQVDMDSRVLATLADLHESVLETDPTGREMRPRPASAWAPSGMQSRQEYLSPDGCLRFVVIREHGDITLGFEGFPWHTHGDVLACQYESAGRVGLSPEAATQRFVGELIHGRAVVVLLHVDGVVHDIWVTDDVDKERKYQQLGEELVFRRWDGTLGDDA